MHRRSPRHAKKNPTVRLTDEVQQTQLAQASDNGATYQLGDDNKKDEEDDDEKQHEPADDTTVVEENKESYWLDGIEYTTYSDMVQAKRQRNQRVLEASGLLLLQQQHQTKKKAPTARKRHAAPPTAGRKSKRLAGVQADGSYVDRESAGRFTIQKDPSSIALEEESSSLQKEPEFYRGRVNDGSDLSLQQATELAESRFHTSVSPEEFVRNWLQTTTTATATTTTPRKKDSPKSVMAATAAVDSNTRTDNRGSRHSPKIINTSNDFKSMQAAVQALSVHGVRKVVPDRIYAMAVHPAVDRLLVAAGDKQGHVGLWNVSDGITTTNHDVADQALSRRVDTPQENDNQEDDDKNHWLFRVHSSPVNCLEWTCGGHHLVSSSYDGTVRVLDVQAERFTAVFSTYDDDALEYQRELGYGLLGDANVWTQYMMLDRRSGGTEQCFFLSTSIGRVLHVDLRVGKKGRITFHEQWSEKKINTLSLHTNCYSMISAGLDCTVKLWDLRRLSSSTKAATKDNTKKSWPLQQPIAAYNGGKSVNSAFFSPSGRYAVSTTMDNKLDLFHDLHLTTTTTTATTKNRSPPPIVQPYTSIPHNNRTGRWLSTFMAQFHPSLDLFCVGSMQHPRQVDLFCCQGNNRNLLLRGVTGLTAVASRCCFYPSTDRLIVMGGNSSGRVTVVQ